MMGTWLFLSWCNTSRKDLAVLLTSACEYKVQNIIKDPGGGYIFLDMEPLDRYITLANMYKLLPTPSIRLKKKIKNINYIRKFKKLELNKNLNQTADIRGKKTSD